MDPNKGKWALVTGGSSGIGYAISRELAGKGYGIILVSRTPERLQAASAELERDFPGCPVAWRAFDLGVAGAAEALYGWVNEKGYEVEVLVNDAGTFLFNDVCATSIEKLDSILTMHVRTVTVLCRLFGERMASRGSGYILDISSYALHMPWPGIAVYGATKAYVKHFSVSLSKELRESGVYVCAVAPGWIDTDLMGLSDRIRGIGRRIGILMSPEKLARRSVRAMFRGRRYIIPGWYNRAFIPIVEHLGPGTTGILRKKTKKYQKDV